MTVIELNNRGIVLRIDELDDGAAPRIVVRSQAKLFWRILWSTLLVPIIVLGAGFAFLPVLAAVDHPPNAGFDEIVLGVACFGIFGVLGLVLAVFGSMVWLQLSFPRTLVFDLRSHSCHFENVPGFGCEIPIDEIQAVVLCLVRGKHGWSPTLCIEVRPWKRFFRVHQELPTRNEPEAAMERLKSAAEYLSQVLACPISRVGRIGPFRTSWR